MEQTVFWILQVLILLAVLANIAKDFWWGKRQKEYYESISPTKVLGDLKSLNELLAITVKERNEFAKTNDELKAEIKRLEEENESKKVAKIEQFEEVKLKLDFGHLRDLQNRISSLLQTEE